MDSAIDPAWQAVVSAALVGSDRQPFQPPDAAGMLGQVLAQLDKQPAESALLATAATLSLYRQVGWLPETGSISDGACPPDDLPPCSGQATRFLQQLLLGREVAVLPEWLKTVANHQQRIPDAYLTTVLELGQKKQDLRPFILPVVGQRGVWLAAQNPDWRYALPLMPDLWETGCLEERVAYLELLRSQDPDQARDLLGKTWEQESANDAAKLLEALRTGLSMADEPFLEEVLGDRRKKVRRIAADLLMRLPQSRLGQRMIERVKPLVTFTMQDGVVQAIEVTLPAECDAAMERDGIEPNPPDQMGERAWWLRQLLEATPLQYWEQQGICSDVTAIASLLPPIIEHEWNHLLYRGWLIAIKRQKNPHWALAWLTYLDSLTNGSMGLDDLRSLLDNLPPEQRQDWFCQLDPSPITELVIPSVLAQDQEPWRDELSYRVLTSIVQALNTNNNSATWYVPDLLKRMVLCVAPNFLPDAIALCSQVQPSKSYGTYYTAQLEAFLATLQFRQEMLQVF